MKLKKIFYFLFLLTLITLIGCSSVNYDSFAKCLTEKGVTMYGTQWCSHCQNQKKEFGESFEHIKYVDCDFDKNKCDKAGIRGYPTWIINGKPYEGEQPLPRLASLTECEL